ncbi:response regulator [Asticcacaulis sp. BYS171W]|uniref:histidine kinase n=1 Tax=Asticcacaulis aquaticus TaxID=2984212 RepID=A0ABT5HV78_9CAUL|nr:PAS domain-containing sensor histidine kinase [Asticcacaulis aquaticus]MDC7683959.1 response regulator [Asticcacaulis aquaticus]
MSLSSPAASAARPSASPASALERIRDFASPWVLGAVAVGVIVTCAAVWVIAGDLPAGVVLAILLIAMGIVVSLGLFTFTTDADDDHAGLGTQQLVDALAEPAAIAGFDGRIVSVNPAWRDAGGHLRRLPQGDEAPALFTAMREARSQGTGRALVRLGSFDFEMLVSRLGDEQVLVRAGSQGVLGTGLLLNHEVAPAAVSGPAFLDTEVESEADARAPVVDIAPATFDGTAAPFGQALLRGETLLGGELVHLNTAFARLMGRSQSDLTGTVWGDLLEAGAREEMQTKLDLKSTGPFEVRLDGNKDLPLQVLFAPSDGGYMLYLFDISEQKQLEQSLAQVQKMQAIGQFAGGVAHDLNNLLTGLKLRVEDLLHNHPLGDPSYDGLNEIRQISVRAEDLVRKLLAFSRKQTVKRVTHNLGELISESEVLLRRLMREDVKLETEYGRDLPDIHADKGQMEMAVMNLVVNARDAVHTAGGGRVKIKTAALSQAEAVAQGWADAPVQGAALIEVSDNGPGIPPDIMTKVFEPFFTTKPLGEGTGLGLATVYGIVNQADGHIVIRSVVAPEQGHGATFKIFLPVKVRVEKPAGEVKPAEPVKVTPKDLSGAGRILFVEDEEIVRGIAARLLRQRGYEVTEACDGEEALDIIEGGGKFDLLISDVIMPGLDGPSMLKKARPHLGNVPVMFISGYAEAEFSDLLEDETGVSFLPKPLDIKTLAEKVKEQLAA